MDIVAYMQLCPGLIKNKMPRISAFTIAQKDIEKKFDSSKKKFYTLDDLEKIFFQNSSFWRLPKSWNVHNFKDALVEKTEKFNLVKLEFPNRVIRRMVWGNVTPSEIALSLRTSAYLSHYTALFAHNLTNQISKTIYVTAERSTIYKKGKLTQKSIDNAFSKPQRISQNIANLNEKQTICLLESKHTNNVGIIKRTDGVLITSVERALIDATVRPLYNGGITEVLEAFVRAAETVSINKLTALLKKIDYTYPYHQAIGFYLEKSNVYRDSQIDLLKRFDFKYDFYLTYNMKEMEYSKEWKLYYPKNLSNYIELR